MENLRFLLALCTLPLRTILFGEASRGATDLPKIVRSDRTRKGASAEWSDH